MTLGERIISCRAAKRMTQQDLAEAVSVSRQAVSKWETDSSVPELDKLIQLCEILDTSMDYLTRGIEPAENTCREEIPVPQKALIQKPERRLVAGLLFLLIGLASFIYFIRFGIKTAIYNSIYVLPFFICGALCFLTRRQTAFWCGWTAFFSAVLYHSFFTTISWRLVFMTFRFPRELNYIRLIWAWGHVLFFLVLLAATVFCFRSAVIRFTKSRCCALLVSWVLFLAMQIVHTIYIGDAYWWWYTLVIDGISFILLPILFVFTYHFIQYKKQNKPAQ